MRQKPPFAGQVLEPLLIPGDLATKQGAPKTVLWGNVSF